MITKKLIKELTNKLGAIKQKEKLLIDIMNKMKTRKYKSIIFMGEDGLFYKISKYE